jgi:hypothetical protein
MSRQPKRATEPDRAVIDLPAIVGLLVSAVRDVGFPIVITAYLLFRLDNTLQILTTIQTQNAQQLQVISSYLQSLTIKQSQDR